MKIKMMLAALMMSVGAMAQNLTPSSEAGMKYYTVGNKKFHVSDVDDTSHVYRPNANKANCFVVISKKEYRLYVYEVVGGDTLLAASYPVCYAVKPGPKTRTGDMSTPECGMQNPFYVSQIADASSWKHNFGDGRGNIPAYGAWFIRLKLNGALAGNRSIGIHGCGANNPSVPGRDSEGCIRLRNNDIKDFKQRFVQVGTKIIIKSISQGKLPFEVKAEKALGAQYVSPKPGYRAY